uniref:Uncharacterized protein n=1 Tax=Solanum lycopersicum TaxID=4081 RepID=A0A3Q7I361_SOLLC
MPPCSFLLSFQLRSLESGVFMSEIATLRSRTLALLKFSTTLRLVYYVSYTTNTCTISRFPYMFSLRL